MQAYLGDQFTLINAPIPAFTLVRPFEACRLSGQTLNKAKAASSIHGCRNKKQLLFLALSRIPKTLSLIKAVSSTDKSTSRRDVPMF